MLAGRRTEGNALLPPPCCDLQEISVLRQQDAAKGRSLPRPSFQGRSFRHNAPAGSPNPLPCQRVHSLDRILGEEFSCSRRGQVDRHLGRDGRVQRAIPGLDPETRAVAADTGRGHPADLLAHRQGALCECRRGRRRHVHPRPTGKVSRKRFPKRAKLWPEREKMSRLRPLAAHFGRAADRPGPGSMADRATCCQYRENRPRSLTRDRSPNGGQSWTLTGNTAAIASAARHTRGQGV